MKIVPDCIPCTYKVCLSALNTMNINDKQKCDALCKLSGFLSSMDIDVTPAIYHSAALHFINNYFSVDDPFRNAKHESNIAALSCMDHLNSLVQSATDPLFMAFKVSAAGNIIDMGIVPDFNLDAAIDEIPGNNFYINCYDKFRKLALSTGSVLIVGDNSGEIAFDMLLVKELQKLGIIVVYAVKGGPILNDATMDDAVQVGMTGICRVITNGNNLLGTNFTYCSQEFVDEFSKAGVVVFKGQANYESQEDSVEAGPNSFFVLRVKCECLGKYAEAPFGSLLFKKKH